MIAIGRTDGYAASVTTPNGSASTTARYFALDRDQDPSGVSGLGRIAYAIDLGARPAGPGVLLVWDTGHVTVDWRPSMDVLTDIHGHDGKTRLTPLDPDDWVDAPAIARARELLGSVVHSARIAMDIGSTLR